ncbi:hypothetical protein [Ruminococcus sp.]|uniref:hypothetical protein n=1 Tax=Ruminococcus sp. TaxID=41978 RepID=UPI0025F323B8|nr:hypothetical protein [Ruminococcus sp.]
MAKYTPGKEPQYLKSKLKIFFDKIDEFYPDKIIIGLHNDHKKLGEKLTALYRELGYEDGQSFLAAYGYTVVKKAVSARKPRVSNKVEKKALLIETIKSKLTDDMFITNIPELKKVFPELSQDIDNSGIKKQELADAGIIIDDINIIRSYRKKQKEKIIFGLKEQLPKDRIFLTADMLRKEYPDIGEQFKAENVSDDDLKRYGIVRTYFSVSEAREYLIEELKNQLNGKKLESIDDIKKTFPDLLSLISYSILSKQQYEELGIIEIDHNDPIRVRMEEKRANINSLIEKLKEVSNGRKFKELSEIKEKFPELYSLTREYSLTADALADAGIIIKQNITYEELLYRVRIGQEVPNYYKITQSDFGLTPSEFRGYYRYSSPGGKIGDALNSIISVLSAVHNEEDDRIIDENKLSDNDIQTLKNGAEEIGYKSVKELLEAYGFGYLPKE